MATAKQSSLNNSHGASKQSPATYISQTFQKRECVYYVPRSTQTPERCCCGQQKNGHYKYTALPESTLWSIADHTKLFQTDAYGTVEFMGYQHPYIAQFVRLSFDSKPVNVMHLFQNVWRVKGPNLVITVHGSYDEIQLQTKLARVFQSGLIKATKTTGAWIITSGLNSACIVRRVSNALKDAGHVRSRKSIVSIGVAPWGLVKKRNVLKGVKEQPGGTVQYYHQATNIRVQEGGLNNFHTYFLLADNGTRGRYGAEIVLRKRLEEYILTHDKEKSGKTTPMVCVVLDGASMTLRSALDYVSQWPPIPVVICGDSGKISNLINGVLKLKSPSAIEQNKSSMLSSISQMFNLKLHQAEIMYEELLLLCLQPKAMINCFEIGEDFIQNDFDHAILKALLKCHQNQDKFKLALTWNRVDIARGLFVYGKEWTADFLDKAMLEALKLDRVDFVRLLIENGVQMDKFLTIRKLESLYNTDKGPTNTLSYIVRDIAHVGVHYKYKLPDIGLVMEKLMGGSYKSEYTSSEFKKKYAAKLLDPETNVAKPAFDPNKSTGITVGGENEQSRENDFKYPLSELFVWAVLTKRQQMALCMWQHGEQALTKALVALRLYKRLSYEAADDYLDQEVFDDYQKYAKEFQRLSIELLDQCYRTDRDKTLRLLTYELDNWGKQTNLSLAFIALNKEFVAHTCCQYLLSDLWLGGLRIRRYTALKIILGFIFPAFVLMLNFKSKQELMLQAQRADELKVDLELDDSADPQSERGNDEDSFGGCRMVNEKVELLKGYNLSPGRSKRESKREAACSPTLLKGGNRTNRDADSLTSVGQKIKLTYGSDYGSGPTERPLSPTEKFYEFFVSPLATFWIWTVAYAFFLCLFSLTVLITIEPWPDGPNWYEWYVMAYVVTLACENFRRICISEGRSFGIKVIMYFNRPWNLCYSSAIFLFFVAMTMRFFDRFFVYARLCYICDSVLWYILLLDILSVDFETGVYVITFAKMIVNMFKMLLILACHLIAFGVVYQSIRNPQDQWNFLIIRNILYKPYFMLYGEIYAEEVDPCYDEGKHCNIAGNWITPIFMAAYMLVSNILIMNLMIAKFNNIYVDISTKAQEVWRFYRYSVVLDYEYKPFLAPPFITLYHVYFLLRIGFMKKRGLEQPLKLNLAKDSVDVVENFEEGCMKDLHTFKEFRKNTTPDEIIKATSDIVEYVSMKQDDIGSRLQMMNQNTVNTLRQILHCLKKVFPQGFDRQGTEDPDKTDTKD